MIYNEKNKEQVHLYTAVSALLQSRRSKNYATCKTTVVNDKFIEHVHRYTCAGSY